MWWVWHNLILSGSIEGRIDYFCFVCILILACWHVFCPTARRSQYPMFIQHHPAMQGKPVFGSIRSQYPLGPKFSDPKDVKHAPPPFLGGYGPNAH
jgi:hypothetical protein